MVFEGIVFSLLLCDSCVSFTALIAIYQKDSLGSKLVLVSEL
jgi:hypothetical protein